MILIKEAAAVVIGDKEHRVLYDTDILIDGPQIRKIGRNLSSEMRLGTYEIVDGRSLFVYPGLVNTHHHFFQAFVRNNVWLDWSQLSVMEWIETIYPFFASLTSEAIFYTSLITMADLIRHGCTTAFDHQYCYPAHAGKELVDRQMEAAEFTGIRFHAGRGANTLPAEDGSLLPDVMIEDVDTFIRDCDRLVTRYHDPERFSMRRIAVAPCQPINCTPETFTQAADFARARQVTLHSHLGEGEDPAMLERYGKRSLAWCIEKGFFGPDVWFAHGWDLQEREVNVLAESGTGLAHCPAPVFLGGFPIIDIPHMHAKGLKLGFGCDGQASNDNSNLLETVRGSFLLQSLTAGSRNSPLPEPAEFLRMASAGGAEVLGRDDIGMLLPGMAADMFMLNVDRLEYIGALHDPASLPVKVGISGTVDMTIIQGRIVYQNGRFTGFNERKAVEAAKKCCLDVMYRNPNYARRIIRHL